MFCLHFLLVSAFIRFASIYFYYVFCLNKCLLHLDPTPVHLAPLQMI